MGDPLAREAQLGFFPGVGIANKVERPKWTPANDEIIFRQQQTRRS